MNDGARRVLWALDQYAEQDMPEIDDQLSLIALWFLTHKAEWESKLAGKLVLVFVGLMYEQVIAELRVEPLTEDPVTNLQLGQAFVMDEEIMDLLEGGTPNPEFVLEMKEELGDLFNAPVLGPAQWDRIHAAI